MPSECVSAEQAAALFESEISAEEIDRLEKHADSCPACRQVLAPHIRLLSTDLGSSSVSPADSEAAPLFTRGEKLGRYRILERVGAGGMGVVYAAHDPQLDRRVAIKLLRNPRVDSERARARLLREAQALARLADPNVVAVHEIGTWREQVFLSMEFVEGGTVTEWLAAAPRSLDEVLRVYAEAGRGLAAAHRAGLVHRDFKPENVLVGKDGRVRVTDFGLARDVGVSDPELPSPEPAWSRPSLTKTGAILGTPGYMAPEQRQGIFDARSDQYSFCVSLHQGLFGVRPGGGAPTSGRRVPDRVQRLIARGLSLDPDKRHPSMDALIAGLTPERPSRRNALVVGALMAAAAVAVPTYLVRRQNRLCSGGAERFDRVWSAARRGEVKSALLATKLDYAERAAEAVSAALDDYRRDWVTAYTDACEATRLRGDQTENVLELRMSCIGDRLDEVDALTAALTRTDEKRMSRVIQAARSLTPVDECANVASLQGRMRPPADAETRARIDRARKELATVKALFDTGDFAAARKSAVALTDQARPLGYAPLLAEVLYQLGVIQNRQADYAEAERTLFNAALTGESSQHDEITASARALTVSVLSSLGRFPDGHKMAQEASAAVARLRGRRVDLEVRVHRFDSDTYRSEGKYPPAIEEGRRAVDLAEARLGPTHLETINSLANLASAYGNAEQFTQAYEYEERARKLIFAIYPPGHPQRDACYYNLGCDLFNLGRFDEARAQYELAVAAVEAREGKDSNALVWLLEGLGQVATIKGDGKGGLALFRRALVIREKTEGPDHFENAMDHCLIAQQELALGNVKAGLESAERGVAIFDKQKMEAPFLAVALSIASDAQLALGAAKKAQALAERALKIEAPPSVRAGAEIALAHALWEAGGDRARARALAVSAQKKFHDAGPSTAEDATKAEVWLAKHR